MGRRTTPPYRADHVGSLLRPPELLRAREEHAAGRLDAQGLRVDAALREVLARPQELGRPQQAADVVGAVWG